jgi:N-glycosylase/DNA lyase
MRLSDELLNHYENRKMEIRARLQDFAQVPRDNYFYELCYCICTPQSKAVCAGLVQKKLQEMDFYHKKFNPVDILGDKEHYIRFHNRKSEHLLAAIELYPKVLDILDSSAENIEKRNEINSIILGVGMKESSHFMRNIGYRGLSILDRHIIKNMAKFGIIDAKPNLGSKKKYIEIERKYLSFASDLSLDPDELDLLFWSFENGDILK